jgi:DNA-binding transcriptional regulator YhcF (GntR family)
MQGWIKLHRKLLHSSIFQNPNLLKFWIWCLLKASHCDHNTRVGLQEVELKEGQFIFGRNKAATELNMNPSTVYRYLSVIEKEGLVCANRNNKFTVVTIANWGLYQTVEHENEQQMNNKRTTNEQQMNTNKNVKNVKNVKNIYDQIPLELHEPLKDYIESRKKLRKPMTDRALELMLKKLNKLSEGNTQKAIEILEQSIANGWIGIFPLKDDKAVNPFKEALRKEIENEQKGSYSNYDSYQGGLSQLLSESSGD